MKGRLSPVWDAARERGVSRRRVGELACSLRGEVLPPDYTPIMAYGLCEHLTDDQLARLEQAIRREDVNAELVEAYRREQEIMDDEYRRARRSAARFSVDDPHLQVQAEGWGL